MCTLHWQKNSSYMHAIVHATNIHDEYAEHT